MTIQDGWRRGFGRIGERGGARGRWAWKHQRQGNPAEPSGRGNTLPVPKGFRTRASATGIDRQARFMRTLPPEARSLPDAETQNLSALKPKVPSAPKPEAPSVQKPAAPHPCRADPSHLPGTRQRISLPSPPPPDVKRFFETRLIFRVARRKIPKSASPEPSHAVSNPHESPESLAPSRSRLGAARVSKRTFRSSLAGALPHRRSHARAPAFALARRAPSRSRLGAARVSKRTFRSSLAGALPHRRSHARAPAFALARCAPSRSRLGAARAPAFAFARCAPSRSRLGAARAPAFALARCAPSRSRLGAARAPAFALARCAPSRSRLGRGGARSLTSRLR